MGGKDGTLKRNPLNKGAPVKATSLRDTWARFLYGINKAPRLSRAFLMDLKAQVFIGTLEIHTVHMMFLTQYLMEKRRELHTKYVSKLAQFHQKY